jgi:hypothetical protein
MSLLLGTLQFTIVTRNVGDFIAVNHITAASIEHLADGDSLRVMLEEVRTPHPS